jgi:hypothetical protein
MAKLEEIGVEEMRKHLRVACARRSGESFFDQVPQAESGAIHRGAIDEMRNRLRQACAPDPEDDLLRSLMRGITDRIQPVSERDRWRPHPLLLLWAGTALFAAGVFLYCSFFS